MRVTTITIKRGVNEATVATGILAKIDQQSTTAIVEHLAAGDHHVGDRFIIRTLGWNPNALVKRGDLIIDELFTDEDNANGYSYRYKVTSRPKNFDLHHQEFIGDTSVGN